MPAAQAAKFMVRSMHEISLCENIRDILEEHAVRDQFSKVKRVRVELGPLSSVEPEALRFGFDVVMRGSVGEGASLEIEASEASALCLTCLKTVPISGRSDTCPECGASTLEVMSGEELRIKELEVV